jgi:NAD(P)-dependent dehydrogenase (short-subunit alcohol dehydrogenase family)
MAFETTTADVLAGMDLDGVSVLVTGASSGIGWETARALAGAGAQVTATARTPEGADATASALLEALGGDASIEPGVLELTSLDSVRSFAEQFRSGRDRLQVLVNNAGVMATPLERTMDGFELQLGTNHLGPFVLTNRLLPLLLAAAADGQRARIVNVSSAGHQASGIRWEDPGFAHTPYDKWEAYGQSKTANILFARELDRRLGDRGVRAFALHPGMIGTSLARYLSEEDFAELRARASRSPSGGLPSRKSLEQGAATSVWAAVSHDLDGRGGLYLADCEVADSAPWAADPEEAARLWALSEELVGERFDG